MLSARGPHEHTFLPFSASFLHHALSIAPLYSRALTSPLVPCSSRASRQGFLSLKCRAEPSEGRLGSDGLGSGGPPSGGRGGNREGGGSGGGGRGENNDPWNNSNQPPRSSSSSALKLSRDEVNVCLAGLFLYLVMKYFVVEFRYIPSGSMLPTLKEGDRVIVDKIVFKYKRAPQTNDLVVFSAPVDDLEFQGKAFLKRIVAVSGDVIELRGEDREFVTINGRVLPDRGPLFHMGLDGKDKEEGKKKSEGTGTSKDKPETVTVPPGHVFVMGDNRPVSYDSRYWGCLPSERIIGRATRIYWPPHRWGQIEGQAA